MEGNITFLIIIFIIVSRLLAALFRKTAAGSGTGSRERRQSPVEPEFTVETRPISAPPPGQAVDPWSFEPTGETRMPVDSRPFESPAAETKSSRIQEPPPLFREEDKIDGRPSKKMARSGKAGRSSVLGDLEQTFATKGKFLSAFIMHEILEPPKALKKRRQS